MLGSFRKRISDQGITEIFESIHGETTSDVSVEQFCEQWGEGEDEVRNYDVYLVITKSQEYILKKTDKAEKAIYETFLNNNPNFPTPTYYGSIQKDDDVWILIEYVAGDDVREMTDEIALAAAKSLSVIANYYWQQDEEDFTTHRMDDRFDKYWERIQRRALSIQDNPKLAQAYALFLQRQKDCPRTLCNGDFMQWNALWSDGNVLMIDWGFGGIMPYSLDIAREALINLARAICEEILHHKKANFRRNPVGFQGNSTHL
jgi:aminoglycoside phosphotransferase (APT) family kinase protein